MQPMAKGIKQVNPTVITARWLDGELARMRRPKPYKNPITAPRMIRLRFLNSPVPVSVPAMPHPSLSISIIERVQFSIEVEHAVKEIIEHVHLLNGTSRVRATFPKICQSSHSGTSGPPGSAPRRPYVPIAKESV